MPLDRIKICCPDRATYNKVCSLCSTIGLSVVASSNANLSLIVTSILTPKVRGQLSELGVVLEVL